MSLPERKPPDLRTGLIAISLLLFPFQSEATKARKAPASGISDGEVKSLGANAENFLASKLLDPKEKRNREGIIRQLERIARLDKEDPKVTDALIGFIESEIRKDAISPPDLYAIESSIRILGFRGGSAGVEYLGSWLNGPKDVAAHLTGAKSSFTVHRIKRAAIRSLGLSGRDDAAKHLEKARRSLLAGEDGAVFQRDFDAAQIDRNEVKAIGLEKALKKRNLR